MNNVKLKIILDKINQVNNNIITNEDFKQFLDNNLVIKQYIPIKEQYNIINYIMSNNSKFESIDVFEIEEYIDIIKIFIALISYTNIETEILDETSENYDIFVNSYVYTYILNVCSKDFERFCARINRTIDNNNFNQFNILLKYFVDTIPNTEEIVTATKDNEKIIKELYGKEELFGKLTKLQEFNDPMTKKITNELKKIAFKKK